ncbi:MAG: PIN domain-containing protein [Faecousia sp.]
MSRYNVFLDTNIFIGAKYNFAGGALCSLKKHCENGTVALFTNDIILREVQSHIDSDVGLMAKQAKNAIKTRGELVNAITRETYNAIESEIMGASRSLSSQFETFMSGAELLSNSGLSVEVLFDDYFGKRVPFEDNEKKKSEFPDAVVIMSIKRYLEESPDTVLYVVTDDNGWHSALSEISNVYLYKNVRDLLTKITKDENELYSLIIQFMKECIATLQSSAEDWFVEQDWSTSIDSIDACIECEEIEDMFVSSMELVPDGVEYIDADGEYASAVFSGTATFYLGFQYIDHTSEIYDREDHAWYNTIYGKGSAEIKVPFTGTATVLIHDDGELELNASGFDEINLGEDEIMDYQLNPYCTDDDPYFDTCPDCGRPIGLRNDGGNGFCTDCAPNH